jgi:hypothetical protein
MSEKEKYTTIDIEPKNEAQRLLLSVMMSEGALRENERIVALLKRDLKKQRKAGLTELVTYIEGLLITIEGGK